MILNVVGNRHATDDKINRMRAVSYCGWCIRKPEGVRKYNDDTSMRGLLDEKVYPLENRWSRCSQEQLRLFSELDFQINREAYSSEALRRLLEFKNDLLVNDDLQENV